MMRVLIASSVYRSASAFIAQGLRPATRLASSVASQSELVAKLCTDHPNNNVPPHIAELVGRNLHLNSNHPIGIVRKKIEDYFLSLDTKYTVFNGEVGLCC